MMHVRPATGADVTLWRRLRRDGIARYPSAFIATLAEADAMPETKDAARLARGDRFLAFDDATPVGLAGLNRMTLPRAAHRAEVGPFYVVPEAQGSSAATLLMDAVIAYASEIGVWQLELTVNEANSRAARFYQRFGFRQTGRIPNAILGEDGPEHDLVLVLELPD